MAFGLRRVVFLRVRELLLFRLLAGLRERVPPRVVEDLALVRRFVVAFEVDLRDLPLFLFAIAQIFSVIGFLIGLVSLIRLIKRKIPLEELNF